MIAHVFNVNLGLSLKNIHSFDDVDKNKLDSNLLLRGRVFIVLLGFVVFVGWVTMNSFGLLGDPLSLFFVIYTVQFCLAIPVLAASNVKTQGGSTTAWVILVSALLTVAIGLWGMLNISDTNYTLGMTPASWLAILPAIPILTGLLGYSILYMRKNKEG